MAGSPELIKYGALLVGLMLVLLLGVRPALGRARGVQLAEKKLKKGDPKAAGELAASAPQPALPPLEPPAPDPDRMRAQEIFDQVSRHLKHEPSQSSRLLQSWIHSD